MQAEEPVVPIFVSLPTLREPVTTAVEEALEAKGFSRRNIEELLNNGSNGRVRFVILLDAVDELKEKYRQRQLAVTNRLELWGPKTIGLFSARAEMSAWVAIPPETNSDAVL